MEKKAEYQISSSVNEGILKIVLTGEVIKTEIEKLVNEVIAIIKANGLKNVLVDVRTIKGRFGYAEVYSRVRSYPPDLLKVNFAVVDLPENADYESFHETTAQNAGMKLKWFTDIDAAIAWLKNKKKEKLSVIERRKAERLDDFKEVTITIISGQINLHKGKNITNYSENISILGAKIRANILLPVDTILQIDFTLETLEKQITTLGKVKWIKVIFVDSWYEAGVEFFDTPNEAIKKIEDYISWKKKEYKS
jgi:hypothetical protein